MTSVWIVANSRFEWFEVLHVCATKEIALVHFERLRDELIKENVDMVDNSINEGYSSEPWKSNIAKLRDLVPGKICDCDSYPDLQEWVIEEN